MTAQAGSAAQGVTAAPDGTAQAGPAATGRSQTDVVLHGIKKMITDGTLQAGSRLPVEKDLAAELGISRGSLREGVRALCIMGVLETRQGDGTYVTSLDSSLLLAPMSFMVDLQTPDGAEHLQSVRRVLESEAAARAALHAQPEALAEAETALAGIEDMSLGDEPVDHRRVLDADLAFHSIIARASSNPALAALIEALSSRTIRGRMWRAISEQGAIRETHREHRAILAALVAGDPDRARLAMGSHLLAVEDFMHTHPAETSDAAADLPAQ